MKKIDISKKSPQEIQKILSEAYMNIYIENDNELYNPLLEIPEDMSERPELFITHLLSQPDFFTFTCKYIFDINIIPMQAVVLRELWNKRFPMLIACRGFSKSFSLAVYAILLMLFKENRKIVITGASFRQSKIIFSYMENIINNSSVLRSIFPQECFSHGTDNHVINFANNITRAIPIGNGERIRGLRSTNTITDEFSSIFIDVFETVISGFGAVSASPSENVQNLAKQKMARNLDYQLSEEELVLGKSDNQIIIAGTAHYDFNHFSRYHKRWLQIIKSRGDKNKLKQIFGEKYDADNDDLDWKDYSVIRIPIDVVPDGFMDKAQITRSKATMSSSNYIMEFGAGFVTDSDGFFKNSLINQCTVSSETTIKLPSGRTLTNDECFFEPQVFGELSKQYIYGIDPASQQDNFSIIILEDCGEYRKIVNVWVTNNKDHKEKVKLGLSNEHNFYAYVARKIRNLMKIFPCKRMAMDAAGGGIAVMETLRDTDKLQHGEQPILPIIIPGKKQETDNLVGINLIEPINFTSQEWTSTSNHGLKKDLEDRVLLFPFIDNVSLAIAEAQDEIVKDEYSLEKLIFNIEELKQELVSITVSETATGREHFDTPEIKTKTGKKGRMKKDRYSALLMANACARNLASTTYIPLSTIVGGFASSYSNKDREKEDKQLFSTPNFITNQLQNLYE